MEHINGIVTDMLLAGSTLLTNLEDSSMGWAGYLTGSKTAAVLVAAGVGVVLRSTPGKRYSTE